MLPRVAAIVASVAFVPHPQPVAASTALQRCQADGVSVYTDKACAAFGATTLPIPGELLTTASPARRCANIRMKPAGRQRAARALSPRRAVAEGCARSPRQLEADLRGSFSLADVNRLAESYHWVGLSTRAGEHALDRLQRLVRKPLLDSHYFSAQLAMLSGIDAAPVQAAFDGGTLQLVLGGDARTAIDFRVRRHAGCYFIEFPAADGYEL